MGVLLCLVEWFLFAASVLQYSLKLLSITTQPLFMYLPNFFLVLTYFIIFLSYYLGILWLLHFLSAL